MKIILDGMGGDNAPASVVEGAVLASKEMEHEIVLIGQQELIEKESLPESSPKSYSGSSRN